MKNLLLGIEKKPCGTEFNLCENMLLSLTTDYFYPKYTSLFKVSRLLEIQLIGTKSCTLK